MPIDDVEVIQGDADSVYMGQVSFNSRSTQLGGSAAIIAADKVIERAKRIAGYLFEVDPSNRVYTFGTFTVADGPQGPSVAFAEVSKAAAFGLEIPDGEMPGLIESAVFDPPSYTAPFGAHIAMIEADPQIGHIALGWAQFESDHTITPTPVNPPGAKDIDESGITGVAPATVNAVLAVRRSVGVTHIDMPLNAPRVWDAIRKASTEGTTAT